MTYSCPNALCPLYGDCPSKRKMDVKEHFDVDEKTGLPLYFATCDETGWTVTGLSEDQVNAKPVKRTKSQTVAQAQIQEARFIHDRSYSVIVDTVHKRPEYAINKTDYAVINSLEAREIIKKLIRAMGKGMNGKGWVKSGESWHLRFQGAAAKRFRDDQIERGTPFNDRKSYWRIIPDSEFDRLSPKGKSRLKATLSFGKNSKV